MRFSMKFIPFSILLFLVSSVGFAQSPQEKTLADLVSPEVKTRRRAARELGERRFREGVAPLVNALKNDSDPEVRANAAVSLGMIKDTEAIPTLVEALRDPSADVRRAAIRGVVSYSIESDIGFIFARRKGLNTFNPFLETNEPVIVAAFTQVDERILTGLADQMRDDSDVDNRRSAVRALGVLRADSQVPAMVGALTDPMLRIEIFRVLVKLGNPEYGKHVIPYFSDPSGDIRNQAIAAAGLLRTKDAAAPLNELYRKSASPEERGRRKVILEALGRIGDSSSEEIFLENFADQDDDRRRFAFEGLGRAKNEQLITRISSARLNEKRETVKLAQAFALYKLGRPEYLLEIVRQLDSLSFADQAEGYLPELNSPQDLHPYFNRSTPPGIIRMMRAMGKIGTSADLPALEAMLRNRDSGVVNAANLAIQQIKRREKQS